MSVRAKAVWRSVRVFRFAFLLMVAVLATNAPAFGARCRTDSGSVSHTGNDGSTCTANASGSSTAVAKARGHSTADATAANGSDAMAIAKKSATATADSQDA